MELQAYEKEHLKRIREGLAECMVMLKNDGSFPLAGPCRIAAYGNGVRHTVKGGTGSGEVNSHFFISIEEGLEQAGFTVTSKGWMDAYDEQKKHWKAEYQKQQKKAAKKNREQMNAMGSVVPEQDYDLPLSFDADSAIYVVARNAGEQNDRLPVKGDIMLSDTEVKDILALSRGYERFMLVLNTGGPVDLSPVMEVGTILVLSQLGVETGAALASVLLGKSNPSGKLTTTWAAWKDYCPDIDFGRLDTSLYREGIYVGYRYFDTVGKQPLFPFGYGTSYTSFAVTNPTVDVRGECVFVRASVKNTGSRAGKEVVQVYVTAPDGKVKKAWQELAGFAKTEWLKPGEQETVEITFFLSELASFAEEECLYYLEKGDYLIRVGTSSADTKPVAVVSLSEEIAVKRVRRIAPKPDLKEVVYERSRAVTIPAALPGFVVSADDIAAETVSYDKEAAIEPEIRALSDKELCYLSVGNFADHGFATSVIGSQSKLVAGGAGDTTLRLKHRGIPAISMADGPAGLRLAQRYFEQNGEKKGMYKSILPEAMLEDASKPMRWVCTHFLGGAKPPKGVPVKTQYATALPIGTAIAQSWNLAFAQTCGDVVGEEMERFGVNLWLAPGMNIHRSPLCGRNFEYYSEDPLVTGKMAAAITRGVQKHPGCGKTVKHYAVNNQETNRADNNSVVSERALREIYLKGFAICIREAQPCAVMSSYNLLNGRHTSESRGLIEDYLRSENGFEGIVMTDWVILLIALTSKNYPCASAERVAAAGGDLFMPGVKGDYKRVLNALKNGSLPRRQLEENASRTYRIAQKLASRK